MIRVTTIRTWSGGPGSPGPNGPRPSRSSRLAATVLLSLFAGALLLLLLPLVLIALVVGGVFVAGAYLAGVLMRPRVAGPAPVPRHDGEGRENVRVLTPRADAGE
ncbi:MAG: hypothetical protein SFY69_01970 [Planctomycetota bacterium]|nr:hypothetical protein [Planctomycetota bacterium]